MVKKHGEYQRNVWPQWPYIGLKLVNIYATSEPLVALHLQVVRRAEMAQLLFAGNVVACSCNFFSTAPYCYAEDGEKEKRNCHGSMQSETDGQMTNQLTTMTRTTMPTAPNVLHNTMHRELGTKLLGAIQVKFNRIYFRKEASELKKKIRLDPAIAPRTQAYSRRFFCYLS